jgi:ribosomal protein S18 acetylase RimI-like enzyme
MSDDIHIRPVLAADEPALWAILEPIVRSGIYFHGFPTDMSERQMLAFYLAPGHEVFVAEMQREVVGTYFLRPHPFAGDGVASCAYGTAEGARGRGVGHAMCGHSLVMARERGYQAMEFYQVISTNVTAVALYLRNGFEIVGHAPEPFLHPTLGPTEMYVMRRKLQEK